MEQIKKYIRGNSERGSEVIAELEKLGGDNTLKLKGNKYDKVYYIERYKYTDTNTIDFASEKSFIGQLIVTHPDWEEIKLPKPERFKNGDIITCTNSICTFVAIYKHMSDEDAFYRYARLILDEGMHFSPNCSWSDFANPRFATEEEKQKLFDAIKENGYRWNAEKKELEKLIEPKFEVGDVIQDEDGYKVKITEVNVEDECYGYESMIAKGIGGIAFSEQDDWKLVPDIKPKFKVGDRIKDRNNRVWFVVQVSDKCFDISSVPNAEGYFVPIEDQDEYELVPNKFDISTLVPFESRVLVRDYKLDKWKPAIWGLKTDDINYQYIIVGGGQYNCCIPYESNEHLLGTKDDCDEYYKTWE